MTAPTGHVPRATSSLAQPPVTAGKQEDDRGAQGSASDREAEIPSDSGYPAQLAVANRRQAARLQAEAQLRRLFDDLGNSIPNSRTSCEAQINKILPFLHRHKELVYDALDMCEDLRDDAKKHMTYTALSDCLMNLPFKDGKGLAFAIDVLTRHDALPPERQNPGGILDNFLVHSEARITELPISQSEKDYERLRWYALVIPFLYQHRDKIFPGSGNRDDAATLRRQILHMVSSLISCMRQGKMQEEDEAQKAIRAFISEIVFSYLLPVLEKLSLFAKTLRYKELVENLCDLFEADKEREAFALKVLDECEDLTEGNLTPEEHEHVIRVLLAITMQIHTFPSRKAECAHRMRAILLEPWERLGHSLQLEIIKSLSLCTRELDPTEKDTHISALKEAADSIQDQEFKTIAQQWISDSQKAAS